MSELDGKWACQSATVNGKTLDDDTAKSLVLTLKGAQYKTESNLGVLFDSTYTIDEQSDPKHIDMMGIGELAGKIGKGIYELDGDRLTMCYTMPGKERPQRFECLAGSEAHLLVWRRVGAENLN
jgi:uncharacterized protein (TIGR03067 family)